MTTPDVGVLVADLIARGPHTFTIVTPVTGVDRYGSEVLDYGSDADRRTARGWVQTRSSSDIDEPDRQAGHTGDRTLYTHTALTPLDRIEHDGTSYLIDGAIDHLTTPRGLHHYRAVLRTTSG